MHRALVWEGEGVADAGWRQGSGFDAGVDPRLAEPDLDAGSRSISRERRDTWSG